MCGNIKKVVLKNNEEIICKTATKMENGYWLIFDDSGEKLVIPRENIMYLKNVEL